jgi:hypothetical protein
MALLRCCRRIRFPRGQNAPVMSPIWGEPSLMYINDDLDEYQVWTAKNLFRAFAIEMGIVSPRTFAIINDNVDVYQVLTAREGEEDETDPSLRRSVMMMRRLLQ